MVGGIVVVGSAVMIVSVVGETSSELVDADPLDPHAAIPIQSRSAVARKRWI